MHFPRDLWIRHGGIILFSGITRARIAGMDLARPCMAIRCMYPSRAGTVVTYAGWMGGYGNMIELRHQMRNGHIRYTRYGHLSRRFWCTKASTSPPASKLIGRVGSTGISTGPAFALRSPRCKNGQASQPRPVLLTICYNLST